MYLDQVVDENWVGQIQFKSEFLKLSVLLIKIVSTHLFIERAPENLLKL